MNSEERILVRRGMGIGLKVEGILKRKYGVKWFKLKPEDELRLLRLVQWQEKYRVSLDWILAQLLPIWRSKYSKYKTTKGLGVSVATLVGMKSELMLQEAILKDFPEGENIARWLTREQQRQWFQFTDRMARSEDWENPRRMLKVYRRRMEAERSERREFALEQQRRNYRNNPWR
jgi:hypothetical protein